MSSKSDDSITTVRRFQLRQIRPPCNLLILGPQASGKTIIINALLRNIRIRGRGVVFSSDPMNYDYLNQKYWEVYEPTDDDTNLSKCDVRVFEDDVSEECFSVYDDRRAFNIIALQTHKQLSKSVNHSKLDYLILMGGLDNLRTIWFDLAGIVPKYKQFKKIYEACTDNYDFLLIDFSGHSRKIFDHVYWGRSDWRFGEFGKRGPRERGSQEKTVKIEDITSQISKTFEIHQASEATVVQIPKPAVDSSKEEKPRESELSIKRESIEREPSTPPEQTPTSTEQSLPTLDNAEKEDEDECVIL